MLIPRIEVGQESIIDDNFVNNLKRLSYCSDVSIDSPAFLSDDERALKAWEPLFREFPCRIGPIDASNACLVEKWMDIGPRVVLVKGKLDDFYDLSSQLPRERLVPVISQATAEALSEAEFSKLRSAVAYVMIQLGEEFEAKGVQDIKTLCRNFGKSLGKGFFHLCVKGHFSALSAADRNTLVGDLHHINGSDFPIDIECTDVMIPQENEAIATRAEHLQSGFCIGESLIACLNTDRPDGLFATVVCDEMGLALGLTYSSGVSLCASLRCGRSVFWSRSRSELWRKGDTSGAYQELLSIAFDCDADAIRFKVRQYGSPPAFCHKGTRTCWGEDYGLAELFRMLTCRKSSAPDGSYTKRLFDDRQLLRNKLLEEAQEVVEAVNENDKVHVAEEVADLTYFLLVACASGNATLEEVSKILQLRSRKVKRRPGNAKDHRIKAADEVLGSTS